MLHPLIAALILVVGLGTSSLGFAAAHLYRVPDTLAQRLQACTPCHGKEGVATPEGYYPRIAGKPQGYLYEQLLHFQQGRRPHATMQRLVQPLSAAYLLDMAGHFSQLDLPYPAPPPVRADPQVLRHGRRLLEVGDAARGIPACAACHGKTWAGMQPATPGLIGLSQDYLTAQLGAWRNGLRRAREPDCMKVIAQRLQPADVQALAAALSAQAVDASVKPEARPAVAPAPLGLACALPAIDAVR